MGKTVNKFNLIWVWTLLAFDSKQRICTPFQDFWWETLKSFAKRNVEKDWLHEVLLLVTHLTLVEHWKQILFWRRSLKLRPWNLLTSLCGLWAWSTDQLPIKKVTLSRQQFPEIESEIWLLVSFSLLISNQELVWNIHLHIHHGSCENEP